jgi:hypothetical protein
MYRRQSTVKTQRYLSVIPSQQVSDEFSGHESSGVDLLQVLPGQHLVNLLQTLVLHAHRSDRSQEQVINLKIALQIMYICTYLIRH